MTTTDQKQKKPSKTYLVKIQLSQFPRNETILIYDKDGDILYDEPASEFWIKELNKKRKAFYWAHLEKTNLIIDAHARYQNW